MTVRAAMGRRAPAVLAMTVGACIAVVGSLLPWVRTGSARRNSYDVFALADRLGFAPGGAVAEGLRWWPLVPLLAATAVIAAWWGWPRAGGALGVIAGAYAGGVGLAVATADAALVIDVEAGAVVTAAGGVMLVLGSAAAVIIGWRPPRDPGRRAHL